MSNYGVPATALNWDSFGEECINIVHGYLCDKKLSLSEYLIGILDGNGRTTSSVERLGNQSSFGGHSGGSSSLPTYNEIISQGFPQSFIDEDWEKIYRTQQMDIWLSQLGYNLPFFASLRIPGGDYSDKKPKILKVTSLIISALWNNGVDFKDLGGQKARAELSEIVPPLCESVSNFLYQVILNRIRSKRGTIKRDSVPKAKAPQKNNPRKAKKNEKTTVRKESSDEDSVQDKNEEEEEEDSPVGKKPNSEISDEDSVDLEQEALSERNRINAKARQAEKDKFCVARVNGGARSYHKVAKLSALERAVNKREREQEQEYVPIGTEAPPPYIQIEQDPRNRKTKLPKTAVEMEKKTKKTKKAPSVEDFPKSPVVEVVLGGKGKGKGKGKGGAKK